MTKDFHALCVTIKHNNFFTTEFQFYIALKRSNVDGTKELIKMARLKRSKFLHFVSTIGVFPFMSSPIDESTTPPIDR